MTTNERIYFSPDRLLDLERLMERLSQHKSPILKAWDEWQQGGEPGMIIERDSKDSMEFRNRNHQTRHDALRFESGVLRDFRLPIHRTCLANEYYCDKPAGHYIKWTEKGITREYFRILLPAADGKLLSVIRAIDQPIEPTRALEDVE